MTDRTDLRAALRAAIEKRDTIAAALTRAREAVARAVSVQRDAKANLGAFDRVDSEIAAHRAERMREWAQNGGDKPNLAVPPKLEKARAGRADAENELATAEAVLDSLGVDAAARERDLQAAEAEVQFAATKIMQSAVQADVERVKELEAEAYQLRLRAAAAGHVWIAGKNFPFPGDALAVLRGAPAWAIPGNEMGPDKVAVAGHVEGWRTYLAALDGDADAEFGGAPLTDGMRRDKVLEAAGAS